MSNAMRHLLQWALLPALLLTGAVAVAGDGAQGRVVNGPRDVLAYRARPEVENRHLAERLTTLLPQLMAETELDMWLVLAREYAEDPIYFSLVPQPTFAARRITMLVFHRTDEGVERLTVNRYPLGDPYESAWEGGDLDDQWQALGDLIVARDPARIGIDVSRDWPVADGLTHALHERLVAVLPPEYVARLTSAEDLVVRWAETRTASEMETYAHIVSLARMVIGEAFSPQVITPGATTTADVAWYIRQRFEDLNLAPWFMPYVNLQRAGQTCEADSPFCGSGGVIEAGDVLHTDVGVCYLKLCTDTQEMAYVPRLGEEGVPPALVSALATGNRWQDMLTDAFVSGRTGNEILAQTRVACAQADMICSTYTHPIGFFGHAPGPTIGMWDDQDGTPIRGDWPLHENTCYAIEGNIKSPVGAWGEQYVQIKLEQNACFDGERVIYLAGRQTQWHVVR
ncbi:MAG: M24 family metallopeptidase [Pseudomonadota bacterium]